jgi:hypothetical protein
VSPDSGVPSDDTDYFASILVGENMKMNFQTLLDKHPNGIWCSELPDLYKVITQTVQMKCECNVFRLIIQEISMNMCELVSTDSGLSPGVEVACCA